jgi:hypothetical protein
VYSAFVDDANECADSVRRDGQIMDKPLTRRRMLSTVALTALAGVSVPLLSACGTAAVSTASAAQSGSAPRAVTSAVRSVSSAPATTVTAAKTALRSAVATSNVTAGTTFASAATAGAATVPPKALNGAVEIWGEAVFPFDKVVGGQIVQELESSHPGLKIAFSPVDDFTGEKLQVTTAGGSRSGASIPS